MNRFKAIFVDAQDRLRISLVVAALAIVACVAAGGYFLMRPDWQVLFSELSPQDMGAMTGELDRLKVPYVVGEGDGGTILVDRNDVYRTRIKLMSRDIPLHGAVGFELFNNNDLGMTEFAQKINFQRALQGELTRTVLSLSEVRDARVLLALPDQGLFRQATVKPTASVTLTLKPERRLRPEQVSGIQRLVASAVPSIQAQDVTIVDQSGVALTRPAGDANNTDGGASGRLDLKQDTEAYLAHKATAVLERALGAGNVTASVDVTLDMDRVQTNVDAVLGTPSKDGGPATGIVSKERDSSRELGAPLSPATGTGAQGGSNQHEVEYALGRRVEQVIGQPGSIKRIQVAVVVKRNLGASQIEQLRQTVGAAVGASFERGDAVIVQTADGFDNAEHVAAAASASQDFATASQATRSRDDRMPTSWLLLFGALVGVAVIALLVGALMPRRTGVVVARLTLREREEALAKLNAWMAEDAAAKPRETL